MAVAPGSSLFIIAVIDYKEKQFYVDPTVYRIREHAETAISNEPETEDRTYRIFEVKLEAN